MIPHLKILVASPDDVKEERACAHRVIQRVQADPAFNGKVEIVPVFWERQPQHAGETFQKQINHPAEADIVVCIFWSKLGSPLPHESAFRGADGKPRTGTEYEFEEALHGWKIRGVPVIWVYRSKRAVVIHPGPGGAEAKEKQQYDSLNAFWERRIAKENRAHKWFATADDFESILAGDLHSAVKDCIARADAFGAVRAKLDEKARAWKEQNYPTSLLLRSGQILQEAADIQRTFRSQLDPETNAFISDSLRARSRRRVALAAALLSIALACLGVSMFFWLRADQAQREAAQKHQLAMVFLNDVTDGDVFFALQDQYQKIGPAKQQEKYDNVLTLLKTDEPNCVKDLEKAGAEQVQREKGAWMIISVLNNIRALASINRLESTRKDTPDFDPEIHVAKSALERQLQIDRILLVKTGHKVFYTHIAYDLMVYVNLYFVIKDSKNVQRYRGEMDRHIDNSLALHRTDLAMHTSMIEINRRLAKFYDSHPNDSGWLGAMKKQFEIQRAYLTNNPNEELEKKLSQAYVNESWDALRIGKFEGAKYLSHAGMERYKKRRPDPYFGSQYHEMHTTFADALLLLHEFAAARKEFADNKANLTFRSYALRDLKILQNWDAPRVKEAFENEHLRKAVKEMELLLTE